MYVLKDLDKAVVLLDDLGQAHVVEYAPKYVVPRVSYHFYLPVFDGERIEELDLPVRQATYKHKGEYGVVNVAMKGDVVIVLTEQT